MHIEFLIEEESCAECLNLIVPKIIGLDISFFTHVFQGKRDLLSVLPARLRGYAKWLPNDWRVVVLVDRDEDDCHELKNELEGIARESGLLTRTTAKAGQSIQVLNLIAIEELEAWFLGDIEALVTCYPRFPPTLTTRRGFRDSDAVSGGTWEALERTLQKAGYYRTGVPKVELARTVASQMIPECNRSRSFQAFRNGLIKLCKQ